jgi:hypothetical protein
MQNAEQTTRKMEWAALKSCSLSHITNGSLHNRISNNLVYGGIMEQSNRPVHSFRYGNVVCCVWADGSPIGYFFNSTFAKIYKTEDSWGESTSFDDRDLPNLMKAAADAHSWIHQQKAQAAEVKSTTDDAEIPSS